MRHDLVNLARLRNGVGHYDKPEVLATVAERVHEDLRSPVRPESAASRQAHGGGSGNGSSGASGDVRCSRCGGGMLRHDQPVYRDGRVLHEDCARHEDEDAIRAVADKLAAEQIEAERVMWRWVRRVLAVVAVVGALAWFLAR